MIPLEGRMITGLDEFMLRIGHLKVLCRIASIAGGSWFRIARDAADVLTRPTPVPRTLLPEAADYLKRKRLCPVACPDKADVASRDRHNYRYTDIYLETAEDGPPRIRRFSGTDGLVELWWQDVCLASPDVVSRVGAVTASAKSGSKTGLSHVCDWAQFVNLIGRAGQVSPLGRIILHLSFPRGRETEVNPYVIGVERLAFASLLLGADIDFFSRFARPLLEARSPIRKADGTRLFVNTVSGLAHEARETRLLSTERRYRIFENMRDLENAAKRGKQDIASTSTAWHRVSSRLETYTDLNLLAKGRGDASERYEYVYYPTTALERAVRSLESARDARDWIESYLTEAILDTECTKQTLTDDEVLQKLPSLVASLGRASGPKPIEAIAVGLACSRAASHQPVSIGACRESIETLARNRPDVARLSRGGFGDRAEFVSFDMRQLERASP